MPRLLSAVALAGLLAGPAAACINDSELPRREREFRSQYQIDTPPAQSEYKPGGLPLGGVAVVGAALAVGAVAVCRFSR